MTARRQAHGEEKSPPYLGNVLAVACDGHPGAGGCLALRVHKHERCVLRRDELAEAEDSDNQQ